MQTTTMHTLVHVENYTASNPCFTTPRAGRLLRILETRILMHVYVAKRAPCRKEHPGIYFLVSCMIHLFHFIDVTVRRSEKKKGRKKEREERKRRKRRSCFAIDGSCSGHQRSPRARVLVVIEALRRTISRGRSFIGSTGKTLEEG